ncbi:MAG: hypothetical protein HY315_00380 [Acidobacteria bacterium]|nr:hypothetical protein [Acidobacteriota bacterium]
MKLRKIGLGLGGLFLGGLALGSTIFLAKKKTEPLPPPWWIPEKPGPFSILTEEMEWTHEDQHLRSHLEYSCQPTQFRVYNLLNLELYRVQREGGSKEGGDPVFHITLKVHLWGPDQKVTAIEDERFYATIHAHRGKTGTTLASAVQVGRYVEFRKCHVGGALNGVETGERVVSMAPVKEIRLGY